MRCWTSYFFLSIKTHRRATTTTILHHIHDIRHKACARSFTLSVEKYPAHTVKMRDISIILQQVVLQSQSSVQREEWSHNWMLMDLSKCNCRQCHNGAKFTHACTSFFGWHERASAQRKEKFIANRTRDYRFFSSHVLFSIITHKICCSMD